MKRVAIEVGVAAGLSVAFPLYAVMTMPESGGAPNPLTYAEAFVILLALASFVGAALLLHALGWRRLFRVVWLWVPVVGSALAASAASCLSLVRDAEQFATVWLFMSLWTLPVAATVHFSGPALRWLRKWHAESPADLSITRRG